MRTLFFFLCISCILLGGCFPHLTSPRAKAAQNHGTTFRIHKDSAAVVWARLQEYFANPINNRNPIAVVSDALIQTAPATSPGSTQYTITRGPIGADSFDIKVADYYTPTSTYDIYGPSLARSTALEGAMYGHLGSRQQRYIDSLAAIGVNPLEMTEKPAPMWGMWFGPSYGKHRWGFDFGARYSFIGVGVHFVDVAHAKWNSMPDYVDTYIPHSEYRTSRYGGGLLGFNLFGFWDVTSRLQLNGSVGYYERSYTYLDRSTVTGDYWKSHKGDESYDTQWGAGLGVTYFFTDAVGIGAGYRTIDGADFDLVFRF